MLHRTLIAGLLLGAGLAFVTGALAEARGWALATRGVTASAVLMSEQRSDAARFYLVRFVLPDADTRQEWTDKILDGARIGDQLTVVYDPHDPRNVVDQRMINRDRVWQVPLLFLALVVLLAGTALFLWRAGPVRFGRLLRRRG